MSALEAVKIGGGLIKDLMVLDAARNKTAAEAQQQEFANQLALAQLESDQLTRKTEVLTTAYATQADAYKGLQQALVEDSDLAGDEAWMRNYETVFQNHLQARNMLFAENGITLPELTDSFDIARHELSVLPPDKSIWIDGTTDKLIKDKYGVGDEAIKEIKIAWIGLQPNASKEEQEKFNKQLKLWTDNVLIDGKPVDSFPIPGEGVPTAEEQALESSVLGEALLGAGTLGSLKAIGKFIPKSFWSKLSNKLEPIKPYKFKHDSTGRPAFKTQPTYGQGPSARVDLRTFGLESAQPALARGGLTSFGKKAIGYGLTGAGLLAADEVFATEKLLEGSLSPSVGMDSNVIPESAVQELQNLDKQFGTGTGGLMSLADTIEESQEQTMSQKVKEFFDMYILYIQEYGQRQADQYMSRAFELLSDAEKQEVTEILQ
tara:strand:+ start:1033 stop:2331 length:1299 start_codon:yes stop_codon:yes gene_type:complete